MHCFMHGIMQFPDKTLKLNKGSREQWWASFCFHFCIGVCFFLGGGVLLLLLLLLLGCWAAVKGRHLHETWVPRQSSNVELVQAASIQNSMTKRSVSACICCQTLHSKWCALVFAVGPHDTPALIISAEATTTLYKKTCMLSTQPMTQRSTHDNTSAAPSLTHEPTCQANELQHHDSV